MKFSWTLCFFLMCRLSLSTPLFAADSGEYPSFTQMPARPAAVTEFQNMWDPFTIRIATPRNAPLEIEAESMSDSRLAAGFDRFPWNGRQIARDQTGSWYVLAEQSGTGSIYLASGSGRPDELNRPRGGDLIAFKLIGNDAGAFFRINGGGSRASMVVGDDHHLHVVYHRPDGLWHLKCSLGNDSVTALHQKSAWTGPVRVVASACRSGDIMRDNTGSVSICYSQNDVVYYRSLSDDRTEIVASHATGMPALRHFSALQEKGEDDAAADGRAAAAKQLPLSECESQDAVMDLAPDGTVWLAFRRDFGIWITQRSADGKWLPPTLIVREYAFHPSLIIADGRPLVTYHHDGLRQHPLDVGTNLKLRAGGAATLGYATLLGDAWQTGIIAAPEEVVMHRRGIWSERGTGKLLPQIEQLGWPVLFRDPRGVVWALWQNKTRRWAYSARWMGESFGDIQECRGPFNAPNLPVNAEKVPPRQANDVGLLFYAAAAGGKNRVLFDRLRIPSLSVEDQREILFLDGYEVAHATGVDLVLNEMVKPIAQPALSPQEGTQIVLNPSVTKHGDIYLMKYTSLSGFAEKGQPRWAVSSDGAHFKPVNQEPTDLPEAEKSSTRALDFWKGTAETQPRSYYTNPSKNDPAKKFLRLGFSTDARGSYWIEYSPDGKRWTKGQTLTAPEAMRERSQPRYFDREDPERPIRVYGRVYTETGRSWGVIWTRDLLYWSGLEHLLDPDHPYDSKAEMNRIGATGKNYTMRGQIFLDAVAGKGEDEIYAASVKQAEGLHFCFYWPGQHGRPLTDVGIAVSRDGFNFTRVKNGQRILPVGPPGAWDSGYIFQMAPMQDGENVRVYYRGTAGRREGTDGFHHNLTEIGVAMIRVNGFTFYRPQASATAGTITTIPIQSPAQTSKKLTVNLEGLKTPAAAFAVEVLDAKTGQPIQGFTETDCLPLNGDGIAEPISWKGGMELPSGKEIRLRFYLYGRGLRFYSFGFH